MTKTKKQWQNFNFHFATAQKLLLTFVLFGFFTSESLAYPSRNLTIFTEQNMVSAITKAARIFSDKNNVMITVNFDSSSDLIDAIDSGEPADIFISAHTNLIESLKQKGLVDVYNIGYIAQDHLILVTSKDNPNIDTRLLKKDLSFREAITILDEIGANLILDKEGNSSGFYSSQLLKSYESRNIKTDNIKLFKKSSEDRSSIFDLIKSSPESYAILLGSQIRNDADLVKISSTKEASIFYQALVIAGDNMDTAREFSKFLKSNELKSLMKESGIKSE